MSDTFYILEDEAVCLPESFKAWLKWYETADRHIARDEILVADERVVVSTIFIGINHSRLLAHPPKVFETLIMGGSHNGHLELHSTKAEALAGHAAALQMARSLPRESRLRRFMTMSTR